MDLTLAEIRDSAGKQREIYENTDEHPNSEIL